MESRIISVDLAKDVFEVAVANRRYRIVERLRLSRKEFSAFLKTRPPARVLLESCGTAHYWARQAQAAGHHPEIIPAHYVKPYRRRGKTDRVDTEALLEAHRCVGLLTSTAMFACAGSPHHFPDARHFSSWFGITPREYSSGNHRYLGGISKQGDRYLRMLLIHGARSVLARARQLQRAGKPLAPLQRWACRLEQRVGHNKATCALANKLARICWAVWKYEREFDPERAVA